MLKRKSTKDLVHPGGTLVEGDAPVGGVKTKEPKPKKSGKLPIKDILRSRPFIGGVCVAVALLLAFVVTPLIQFKIAETVSVVVLTGPVPAGMELTADLLTTKEMGVLNLPVGALTSVSEAVGKYAAVAGVEGDILTSLRLSDHLPSDDPELASLPEGKLAMSATLSDLAQSVSGKLRAGDVVRLYAVMDQSAGVGENDAASPVPELQYVEVLAVTNTNARDVRSEYERMGEEVTDSDRQIATVTLAVNNRQAAVLAGLEHNAVLHAALVFRGDEGEKQTALDAQEAYFALPTEEDAAPPAAGAQSPEPAASPAPGVDGGEGA